MFTAACKIEDIPCRAGNYGARRSPGAIKYLVYHYTANDGDTARANAGYFASNTLQASAHYFVDDGQIVRSVGEYYTAWSVGGGKWADCPQTGGGRFYGLCTNGNSISVEMCDTLRDGRYGFSEKTLANAAALGRELMEKYRIPPERVIRHFDVNGKHCPGAAGWWGRSSPGWDSFKKRLEDNMTGEEIYESLCEYLKDKPCPEWAQAELGEAVDMGITDGTRPGQLVTRCQAAIMAKRAAERKEA